MPSQNRDQYEHLAIEILKIYRALPEKIDFEIFVDFSEVNFSKEMSRKGPISVVFSSVGANMQDGKNVIIHNY